MRAMDFPTIAIDAEMVGKLYVLACNTSSDSTNDSVETMACDLLHAAIDAALEVHDGSTGCAELSGTAIKFSLVAPMPEKRVTRKPARKGGSKR